jgi:superoxide dismutase, Fe-Mn family
MTNPAISRRTAIGSLGAAALAAPALASFAAPRAPRAFPGLSPEQLGWDPDKGEYTLPDLPYAPDALEPHIDAETMSIHHGRHHAGYVNGLNRALRELADIREGNGDPALIKHWSREAAFHGSGHINHALFWLNMAPPDNGGGGRPNGPLAEAIDRDFGSFERFVAHFKTASNAVEASGWGWLVYEPVAGRLLILQGEKQQDLTLTGVVPLLGVDVWEHAYYLRYQNRRSDYVNAFMNIINWPRVSQWFEAATG